MDRIDPSVYERADEGLLKLLKKAEAAALTDEEYELYEASMKRLEDEIDMEQHGYERGLARGREETLMETAMEMKKKNFPVDVIAEITHLTEEEINAL